MNRIDDYLNDCRNIVLEEIKSIVPADTVNTGGLYDLMLDYPLRYGKSLRPALCIAVCRALGGGLRAVLPSAAVLELYHNAFLIHDDVEDKSEKRRNEATLNRKHGVPTAVNVGDGMLALAIEPLLDNISTVGLGRAIRILNVVSLMTRETAEGQMMEIDWINTNKWMQNDREYIRLVHKKTGYYSFVAPAQIGAIAGGADGDLVKLLGRISIPLGVAFQIQDDVLNLTSSEDTYGKDFQGDLWEGKHSLILIHAMRNATKAERKKALEILKRKQPEGVFEAAVGQIDSNQIDRKMKELFESGQLSKEGMLQISELLSKLGASRQGVEKTAEDVQFLRDLIDQYGSIEYAWLVARKFARRFNNGLADLIAEWPRSNHSLFLGDLAQFTINRTY